MVYMPQIFHFSDELFFSSVYKLWKMVGLKYNTKTCQQMVIIVAFHVNMLQQIQLLVNSIDGRHEKTPSKTFKPI